MIGRNITDRVLTQVQRTQTRQSSKHARRQGVEIVAFQSQRTQVVQSIENLCRQGTQLVVADIQLS